MWFFRKHKYIPIGQTIHGYEVLDCVGEGRYGICYIVSFQGKKCIYKQLKNRERKKSGQRIYFEAEILRQLDRPSFPAVLAVHEEMDNYSILMEYIEGKTVEEWLFQDNHSFSIHERNQIFLQLLDMIEYLHTKGIVHRDIRPSNVIYRNETVYLLDFGLARWINGEKYIPQIDFSYLGHFLLYLYYSDFPSRRLKHKPWYEELPLREEEKNFCQKLFGMKEAFQDVQEIRRMFVFIYDLQAFQ